MIQRVSMAHRSLARLPRLPFSPAAARNVASAGAGASSSQTWPQRTVRFIVPLPPGSGMDLTARVIAERLRRNGASRSWSRTARAPTAFRR